MRAADSGSIAAACERLGDTLRAASSTLHEVERHAIGDVLSYRAMEDIAGWIEAARRDGLATWPQPAVDLVERVAAALLDVQEEREAVQSGGVRMAPRSPLSLAGFVQGWLGGLPREYPVARERVDVQGPDSDVLVLANRKLLGDALHQVVAQAAVVQRTDPRVTIGFIARARDKAGLIVRFPAELAGVTGVDLPEPLSGTSSGLVAGLWQSLARLYLEKQHGLLAVRGAQGQEAGVLLLLERADEGRTS